MSKISVILVDDHTLLRETWTKILSLNKEYEVLFETGDGEEAVRAIERYHPDLVLLDINMSPMSGFDILKEIRALSPITKVICVSMHSQAGYIKKMFREGAKAYVTKNSKTEELMTAMREVYAGKTYICQEVKELFSRLTLETDTEEGIGSLTDKQIEIIGLLREGLSTKEIAARLFLAPKTVEVHKNKIYRKLNVNNSLSLLKVVMEYGI